MDKNIIYALSELGIDISDVQYKFTAPDQFGMGMDDSTKFVLKGSFGDESNIKRFIDEILIIRQIHNSSNPATKDLYEKLRTISGLTNG